MTETTLSAVLAAAAAKNGDAKAIVITQGGPVLTHAQLQEAVKQATEQLRSLGVQPGDVVSLAFTNTLEFVILFIAVANARATAAPLNPGYTEQEFAFYIEDAASRCLLLPSELPGGNPAGNSAGRAAAAAAAKTLGIPIFVAAAYDKEKGVVLSLDSSSSPLPTASAASSPPPLSDSPLPSDVALFLHTSGTTSRPKGVPLSHSNLASSLANITATYALSPADTSYLVMPLFHVHGLMASLLAQLTAGGSVVLPAAGRFSASLFWQEVAAARATWYSAVPTMHQILLARHKANGPPQASTDEQSNQTPGYPPLRFIRSCSASLAASVLFELEAAFGAPVLEAYAMTEASHQMTSNPLPSEGPHKPGSVGRPTGIQLAILNEEGQELARGRVKSKSTGEGEGGREGEGEYLRGEVCIRGPNVTAGYRSNPAANESAFAFGWFHTGDQGYVDEEGYLFLTGRLKELINRGGEKISPLEVDGAMLSAPGVTEAVSFAAPDSHYGEEVNAAVVLSEGVVGSEETKAAILGYLKQHLSAFKLPKRIFFVPQLPRTATGKIQRRFVAQAMLQPEEKAAPAAAAVAPAANSAPAAPAPAAAAASGEQTDTLLGSDAVARTLAALGVRFIFGVIGIPVTSIATSAQVAGIRFLSFRNEQAAGYAAAAYGYLTGQPGVMLTVSGPGCVHALAGVSHAQVNCWPLLLLSGSSPAADRGKGDFQELDQVALMRPFTKAAGQVSSIKDLPSLFSSSLAATITGRPGAAYVDLPSDFLQGRHPASDLLPLLPTLIPIAPAWQGRAPTPADVAPGSSSRSGDVGKAVDLLLGAERPLLVVGKGAAYAHSEKEALEFVETTGIPFLPSPMAKGLVPDSHPLGISAARSLALAKADVVVVVGARLNWLLSFGEPPKWSPAVKFVLVDVDREEVEGRKPAVAVVGDAREVLRELSGAWKEKKGGKLGEEHAWVKALKDKVQANIARLSDRLQRTAFPLDFHCALRVLRDAMSAVGSPSPILVSEGANTMDVGRTVISHDEPRCRLDAGTWGTMGVGLGFAVAAAVAEPDRLVVALEGDSAFGFSGMELETIVRYKLPVIVVIMNNNGIYGGDRRGPVVLPDYLKDDPAPTSFVPNAKYHIMMEAFGGDGYYVTDEQSLAAALKQAFATRRPAVVNVAIDPLAGSESGSLTHKN